MTIELNIYLFYTLLEAMLVLVALSLFLFFRARKFKPYFLANTNLRRFIRKYINLALSFTRQHAKKYEEDARAGHRNAIIRRRNLVARLNWLVLERDFLTTEDPDEVYWDDMDKRISRMLDQWDLAGIMSAPPSEDMIEETLILNDSGGGEGKSSGSGGAIASLQRKLAEAKARIGYLEKHSRQLESYKNMFEGFQETYETMKKSYKKTKNQLFDLKIEADKAEELRRIIGEHEQAENVMEDQIQTAEKSKERLQEELTQLEAAYMRQMEEFEKYKANVGEPNTTDLSSLPIGEDVQRAQDIMDEQNDALRKLRGLVHNLKIELDVKMAIEEITTELEKYNGQIITCMQILEMEKDRLEKQVSD